MPTYDYKRFLTTEPLNHYGECVAAHELYSPSQADGARILYRCADQHWTTAHRAWVKALRSGDDTAAEPMPEGHSMFVDPLSYARLPVGENRPGMIRRALRKQVQADLSGGWDRELRKSIDGMRTLAKIIRATVQAKMNGAETGAAPYVACVYSML